MHVGYVSSQHNDDKSPLKRRGQGHVTDFKFWRSQDITETAEATMVEFCVQVDCIKS